jgi:cytochrome c553
MARSGNRGGVVKLLTVGSFVVFGVMACADRGTAKRFVIGESKAYEASMFRQNCAICHGPEAEGRTLSDGTAVPNLRAGEFKYKTDGQIYQHISEGGNGMVPFRNSLTEREIKMMVEFVQRDLRNVR